MVMKIYLFKILSTSLLGIKKLKVHRIILNGYFWASLFIGGFILWLCTKIMGTPIDYRHFWLTGIVTTILVLLIWVKVLKMQDERGIHIVREEKIEGLITFKEYKRAIRLCNKAIKEVPYQEEKMLFKMLHYYQTIALIGRKHETKDSYSFEEIDKWINKTTKLMMSEEDKKYRISLLLFKEENARVWNWDYWSVGQSLEILKEAYSLCDSVKKPEHARRIILQLLALWYKEPSESVLEYILLLSREATKEDHNFVTLENVELLHSVALLVIYNMLINKPELAYMVTKEEVKILTESYEFLFQPLYKCNDFFPQKRAYNQLQLATMSYCLAYFCKGNQKKKNEYFNRYKEIISSKDILKVIKYDKHVKQEYDFAIKGMEMSLVQ